jgi:hypothetical protein
LGAWPTAGTALWRWRGNNCDARVEQVVLIAMAAFDPNLSLHARSPSVPSSGSLAA